MNKYILIFLFCFTPSFAHQYSEQEVRIMQNIRCPICNGQSIYDANNELSLELRKIIVNLSSQGKSPAEIEAIFEEKFGSDIVLNKQSEIITLFYLVPLVVGVMFFLGLNFDTNKISEKMGSVISRNFRRF